MKGEKLSEIKRDKQGRFSTNNKMLYKFNSSFINYIKTKENKLEFINNFFGIKPTINDVKKFNLFLKVLELRMQKLSANKISRMLNLSKSTVEKWIWKTSIPRLARLLEYYSKLYRPPTSLKWVSINSTKGGFFKGKWILAPEKITNFNQILYIINQLDFSKETYARAKKFDLNKDDLSRFRVLFFSYLLGVLVGDAGKVPIKRNQRITRRISLSLTKKYESNFRFGEFTSLCANVLGLRMKRIKDSKPGKLNKYSFFRWSSQSSELIEWIFNVCLGLKHGQLTTCDSVNLGWVIKCPRKFRIWFLQGLADSDGYVDFSSFQVGIISQPNTTLIKNILESLGINTSIRIFRDDLEAVVTSVEDAYKIPLFNPFVKSYRYSQMKKLATAEKLHWHLSEELNNKIKGYLSSGVKGTALIRKLLETENIRVRAKAIRRIENV